VTLTLTLPVTVTVTMTVTVYMTVYMTGIYQILFSKSLPSFQSSYAHDWDRDRESDHTSVRGRDTDVPDRDTEHHNDHDRESDHARDRARDSSKPLLNIAEVILILL